MYGKKCLLSRLNVDKFTASTLNLYFGPSASSVEVKCIPLSQTEPSGARMRLPTPGFPRYAGLRKPVPA